MDHRTLLSGGITKIVENHFGNVPEYVLYEGAVSTPLELPTECTELAKVVLSEQPELNEVFSVKDISRRIESIVITIVREGTSRKTDLIESLCTRLERREEGKLVLIPLEGITLTDPVTQIGPFRLRLMNDEALCETTTLWNAAIDRTTNTPEEKAASNEFQAQEFECHLRGCVCLEVRVCADVKHAEGVAVQQASALVDLLRYGSSGLHHKSDNLAIGWECPRFR